jgi:hypothetical protein
VPGSTIINNTGGTPEVYSLEQFISLTGSRETELETSTEIEGDHAERVCTYTKSGVLNGTPFTTRGVKVMRLRRTPDGWRLSALAWDDEREASSPNA